MEGPRLPLVPLVVTGVLASTALGFFLPGNLSLAICQWAFGYGLLFVYSRGGQPGRAVRALLLWALFLIPATVGAILLFPDRASAQVFRGPEYWEQMSAWIRQGLGTEGDPGQYIPLQLRNLGLLVLTSLLTGGALALFGGTLMLGYMNYYVAQLLMASQNPWVAGALAWQPYALCRVVGYIFVGTALAQPLLSPGKGLSLGRKEWILLLLGVGLALADLLLKMALEPVYQSVLKGAL